MEQNEIQEAILVESKGFCGIHKGHRFQWIAHSRTDLEAILHTKKIECIQEKQVRQCSQCNRLMDEGFYFESDSTYYCDEKCLTEVIPYRDYLEIYNDGNGDAYWTRWED